MHPRATALIFACAISALATEAQAVGFGRVGGVAVLGQPLNLPITLRLEPGEQVEPGCVAAEVVAGESRFLREQVNVRIEPPAGSGDWVARIATTAPVLEPIVEITLTVGCERRFSRRFMAFADPPLGRNLRSEAEPVADAPATVPLARAVDSPAVASTEALPPVAARARRRAPAAEPGTSAAPAPRQPVKPRSVVRRPAAPAPATVSADNGGRLLLEIGGPRLKLDMEDPVFVAPAPVADGPAASAPGDTSVSESDRLQLLEKALADLQRESQTSRDATGALKAQLAQAENRNRALPWLASLLILSLGVTGWLAWRMRRQPLGADEPVQWWTPAGTPVPEATDTGPVPMPPPSNIGDLDNEPEPLSASAVSSAPPTMPMGSIVLPPAAERSAGLPVASYERTSVLSGPVPAAVLETAVAPDAAATREVSVEELLDLEQQAEFFIALGQEEAAVELLMSHLRSTGGMSPLPYTKLLEIYRRQDDRDSFERIRARFNRRFNAYAPDWDDGPLSGRALEDYPEVIAHLQALWPTPLDAMAMLEAMLFRRDDAHELFDLPAYKDVLLLYSLARDLWQQGGAHLAAIDVLLPLEDQADIEHVTLDQDRLDTPTDAPNQDLAAAVLPTASTPAPDDGRRANEDALPGEGKKP